MKVTRSRTLATDIFKKLNNFNPEFTKYIYSSTQNMLHREQKNCLYGELIVYIEP